jgi:hypothetical protein
MFFWRTATAVCKTLTMADQYSEGEYSGAFKRHLVAKGVDTHGPLCPTVSEVIL